MTLNQMEATEIFDAVRDGAVAPDISGVVRESRRRQSRRRLKKGVAIVGLVALSLSGAASFLTNGSESQLATEESPPATENAADSAQAAGDDETEDLADVMEEAESAVEFGEFFAQTEWQIVGREGFETIPVGGRVLFRSIESNPVAVFVSDACQSTGTVAIEWNDGGFEVVTLSADQLSGVLASEGEGCNQPDDLLVLSQVSNSDRALNQFDIEIVDTENVNLRRGDKALTLVPESAAQ